MNDLENLLSLVAYTTESSIARTQRLHDVELIIRKASGQQLVSTGWMRVDEESIKSSHAWLSNCLIKALILVQQTLLVMSC